MLKEINEAATYIKSRGVLQPEVGVILGTGLGNRFVQEMENTIAIEYNEIPNFPVSTVETHHGKLIYGTVGGKKVLAMQGRFHYYEGYTQQQITLPVRVMKVLGVQYLLISNAAGNMNMQWQKGQLMLLDDHINLLPANPLRGKNLDEFGPRFPDMSCPYDPNLNQRLEQIAKEKNILLNKGVYVVVTGPNLETRAEYRFLRNIGADAVGMSTVPEVIVANHMGLPCCAISVLTDDCDPDNLKPVNIAEIIEIAGKAEVNLTTLYVQLIAGL
ncbi:MAG TPA: purine-nucleoside phosphorylase [Cyclobacteriaceae bacterium]|nr:purine-nucleoside phosphorylase [Cyclobacteriaceae bacterium]